MHKKEKENKDAKALAKQKAKATPKAQAFTEDSDDEPYAESGCMSDSGCKPSTGRAWFHLPMDGADIGTTKASGQSHPVSSTTAITTRMVLLRLHSGGATKTPMILTLTQLPQHIIFSILCWTCSRGSRGPPRQYLCCLCRGVRRLSVVARHNVFLPEP